MNNINLEKFIYQELQSKGYSLYSRYYKNIQEASYLPQFFALKSDTPKSVLSQHNLKISKYTTQKIHNSLNKRPLIVIKSFSGSNYISDNLLLCSFLKEGILKIPSKDISASLEKYVDNINPIVLVDNIFNSSQDKISYFKSFSKDLTLQSINLNKFDNFLNKNCSPSEKEDLLFWFISKRSKELKEIHVDKKITTYLLDNWDNNPTYLNQYSKISPFLSNQLQNKNLDVFDTYNFSCAIEFDCLETSKIIGFTINKISSISKNFFEGVSNYHTAKLNILPKVTKDSNTLTFFLQHNDDKLNKQELVGIFRKCLVYFYENDIQKIDTEYCRKWYLHEIVSKKLPLTNNLAKVNKI